MTKPAHSYLSSANSIGLASAGLHRLPYTVNYHLLWPCNFRCRYCYATFDDQRATFKKGMLAKDEMMRLVDLLAGSFKKITFAGGEPTLCPWIGDLIRLAKSRGCLTNLVTNGSKLDQEFLEGLAGQLDFLTMSIDSASQQVHEQIGRASTAGAMTSGRYLEMARIAKACGIAVKVNTVVTTLNWNEDLSDLIKSISPTRWKLLQATPVEGQNDSHISSLTPSDLQFTSFSENHLLADIPGVRIIPEPVSTIRGSYVMVDPQGRFFDSTAGRHAYSRPILESGISALGDVSFDPEKFHMRGGAADWNGTGEKSAAKGGRECGTFADVSECDKQPGIPILAS